MASTDQPVPDSLQQLRTRIATLKAQGRLDLNLTTDLTAQEQSTAAQSLSRRSGWAWAALPDLSQLLKHGSAKAQARHQLHRHSRDAGTREELATQVADPFLAALLVSRAYCSPHAASALAKETGVGGLYEHLAGSTVLPVAQDQQVEPLRAALKARINAGWSREAVAQGVAHTRAGQYDEAHRCYDKALELQPDNADAYVARGAAFANEHQFAAAAKDFKHALGIDPHSRNAAAYLQAVQNRAHQLGVSLEEEPQDPQQQQPPEQQEPPCEPQQLPGRAAQHESKPEAGGRHVGAEHTRERGHRETAEQGDGRRPQRRSRSPRRGRSRSRSRSRSSGSSGASSSSSDSDSSRDSGSSGLLSPGAHPSLKAALTEVLKARARSSAKKGHTGSSSKKRKKRQRHESSSSNKRQRRHEGERNSSKAKHKKKSSRQKSRRLS